MNKDLTREIIEALQNLYQTQRKSMKLFCKGEEAILLLLHEKLTKEIVSPRDLSEYLNVSSARIASSLNGLQEKGLVTREADKKDRRKIIVELTKEGALKAEEISELHFKQVKSMLNKLGKETSKVLLEIIKKMEHVIKEEQSEC